VAGDDRQRRMCGSKKRFKDQAAADRAVRLIELEAGQSGALRSYRCEYCGRWHLTSQVDR
jgi:hypothetical protein